MSALAAAAIGMAVFSSVYAGYQAKAAHEMQSQLYRRAAREKRRRNQINAFLIEREADALASKQMTVAAGQGRALKGSVLDIAMDTKSKAAFEILRQESVMEHEIANLQFQSNLQEFYGDSAVKEGWIKGASTGLSGAHSMSEAGGGGGGGGGGSTGGASGSLYNDSYWNSNPYG